MNKSRSNRPGPPKFSYPKKRPKVTSLQMALARDDRRSNNKTDQHGRGAYNFNHNTRKGGMKMPKWMA